VPRRIQEQGKTYSTISMRGLRVAAKKELMCRERLNSNSAGGRGGAIRIALKVKDDIADMRGARYCNNYDCHFRS